MAARYVNPQNVAAQGQAFYTGLLPGSYDQGGPTGGKNVYGAGGGGSAGVTADRTASEATSVSEYKPKGHSLEKALNRRMPWEKEGPPEVRVAGFNPSAGLPGPPSAAAPLGSTLWCRPSRQTCWTGWSGSRRVGRGQRNHTGLPLH